MQLIEGVQSLSKPMVASVVTIGNFDGVHRGHQKLLQILNELGHRHQAPSVVMSFHPHPVKILFPERAVFRLFSLRDQEDQLRTSGVDFLVRQKFDSSLAETSPEDFFYNYLLKPLRPRAIVVGHDFRFGQNRQGDLTKLKALAEKHSVQIEQVDAYRLEGNTVSTSRIREFLSQALLPQAHELLGRNYYVEGEVHPGFGRGKKMGFPTANLLAPEGLVLPKGVYITSVTDSRTTYPAVTNIGLSPTFEDPNPTLKVENFILNFQQDLYHQKIRVEFFKYLRPERKFKDFQELTEQITSDVAQAKEFWRV